MARLDAPPAGLAAADLHLIAADLCLPGWGQIFLVLAGDPLQHDLAAAARAHHRQPDTHHPVDPLGHRPPPIPPIRRARLAARPSGVAGGPVLGERRGLPFARPPQLLDLADQLPDTALEPLVLIGKPLDLAGEPVTLGLHRPALGLHHHDPLAQPAHARVPLVSAPALHRCHRGANHT